MKASAVITREFSAGELYERPRDLAKLIATTEAAIHRLTAECANPNINPKYLAKRTCELRHEKRTLEQLLRLAALGAAGKNGISAAEGVCVVS